MTISAITHIVTFRPGMHYYFWPFTGSRQASASALFSRQHERRIRKMAVLPAEHDYRRLPVQQLLSFRFAGSLYSDDSASASSPHMLPAFCEDC